MLHEILSVVELEQEGAGGATARRLCELLHRHSFALLRLPEVDANLLGRMRALAGGFFMQPVEQKASIGNFRRVGTTYAGYRDHRDCDTEFLEVHVDAAGSTVPPLHQPDGLANAASALHARLDQLGRLLLTAIATYIRVDPAALLEPLGRADTACEGISAAVLRVCHYRSGTTHVAMGGMDNFSKTIPREVLFAQHTDSSMLTLSPLCIESSSLQLLDASDSSRRWVDIEETDGATSADIEVHVGDFLAFLTREYFPSCLHRVLRPSRGVGRISMPLLMRCSHTHLLDTRPYLCRHEADGDGHVETNCLAPSIAEDQLAGCHNTAGVGRREPENTVGVEGHPRLLEIYSVRCGDLGRLFDKRGRRLLDAERSREAREAARRLRAQAFREQLRLAQEEGKQLHSSASGLSESGSEDEDMLRRTG